MLVFVEVIVCGEETGAGTIPKGVDHSLLNYCLSNVPLFVLLGSLPVKISEEVYLFILQSRMKSLTLLPYIR